MSAFISRLIAPWIAAFFLWLAVRFNIVIPDDVQSKAVEVLVGIVIPLFVSLYGLFHKLIDRKTNPGDAASTPLVEHEKVEDANLSR